MEIPAATRGSRHPIGLPPKRLVAAILAVSRNIVPAIEAVLGARLQDCRIVIEAGDLKRGAALRTICERAKTAVAIPCYADADRDIGRTR